MSEPGKITWSVDISVEDEQSFHKGTATDRKDLASKLRGIARTVIRKDYPLSIAPTPPKNPAGFRDE